MRFGLRWVRHLRRAEPHSGIQSRLNVPPGVSVFAGHAIADTPHARIADAERPKEAEMKKLIISALTLAVLQNSASAAPGSATGPTALALAAVIAQHSPAVRAFDKRVIARLFRGNNRFGFTPNTKISVDADSVVCRVSNVDITSRSCELTFGSRKRTLTGREANEVGATAAAAGVPSEGAAGSSIESISKLRCTIDPNEIMQKAGGGANCTFETGQ